MMNAFHKVVAKAIEASKSPEDISLQETEEKFSSLVLAFKTDRETLDKRKDLHLRARDIAENNIQKELEGLKDGMKTLNQICNNSSSQQTFAKVQHHIEVLEQSVARMSSQAEVHGAVQQELRVSRAIDVMVHHVENLKKVYEKEHTELLEARKTLRVGRSDSRESGGNDTGRSANLSGVPQYRANRRRASISVISKNPLQLRNNLPSGKLTESGRLVHRNSAFISTPTFLEEDEDIKSSDTYRHLERRKSSSILELPRDFLNQLQAASRASTNSEQEKPEEAEDKKEEAEEEEEEEDVANDCDKGNDTDKEIPDLQDDDDDDDDDDDGSRKSSLVNHDGRELDATHESEGTVRVVTLRVFEKSIWIGRALGQRLSKLTSGLDKAKRNVRSASRSILRTLVRSKNTHVPVLVVLFLVAFVIFVVCFRLIWRQGKSVEQ